MQIFQGTLDFDFMVRRKQAVIFSGSLILVCLVSFLVFGFNKGIDFTGGTILELDFPTPPDMAKIRSTLAQAGYKPTVQKLGTPTEVLIRVAPRDVDQAVQNQDVPSTDQAVAGQGSKKTIQTQILQLLRQNVDAKLGNPKRIEFVGAQVGEELRDQGGIAILLALAAILVYVWLRFEKRFALGAIFALIHDVIIVVGFFSIFQIQFDLTILAAILAVIGYSLNDTIVVFDRIRENFRKLRKTAPIDVLNRSLNETLARTVMTSVTTLLVLIALFFLGGQALHGFSLALIVGVFIGTYSSIYVASITALVLGVSKEDLMPVAKEGEDLQNRQY